MRLARLVVVVLVAVLGAAASAGAAEVKSETVAMARLKFESGRALYRAGKYRDAIREFEAGYAAVPKPSFLLNIGQAHRQLFELELARKSYIAFLEQSPADDPDRAQVSELVRNIDRVLAERAAQSAASPAPTAAPEIATSPPAVPRKSFVRRHWWIFPVGAAVLTGIGVGIYFAVRPAQGPSCSDADFGCLDATR